MRSKRGVGGGYVLARSPEEITLAQVVSAVDGPIVAGDFGEPHTGGACDHEGQCILLAVWAEVGEAMRHQLPSFTLADMVARSRGTGGRSPGRLTGPLVPWLDDRRLPFPAQDAERPGVEGQQAAGGRREAHPAGGQHPQQVAVGEAQGVARRWPAPAR